MYKLSINKDKDMNELRTLRTMVQEAERMLKLSLIPFKEYQYILSKALASLELMEAKYGL